MNQRENSFHHSKNYKISKMGLLENDKKLIIKKLGLNNLSYSHLPKVKEKKNIYSKTVVNLNDEKQNSKKSLLTKTKKKYKNFSPKKIITPSPIVKFQKKIKFNNNNPNATFSSNEIINKYNNYKKSLNHNKDSIEKKLINNNKNNKNSKSYSNLPIKSLINTKILTNNSLNKKHKQLIKDIRKNSNHNNSLKENKTYTNGTLKQNRKYSNKDSPGFYSGIKLIKKIKIISGGKNSQNKEKISKSIPNLLFEFKNLKNTKKEQSIKIFNDNILVNNLNNEKEKNKYMNKIGEISPIKKSNNRPLNSESKKNEFTKSRINANVIEINIIKKRNKSFQDSKTKNISIYLQNINKNVEYKNENNNKKEELQRTKFSESNDNSEDTKKESGLNLHKIFGDKTFINIDNNNMINEIISYNMKINLSDNKGNKNIHSPNINEINASFNGGNSSVDQNNKYNDKQRHMNYFNNLHLNNDEQNYSTKNENISSANENNDNNNYCKSCSKIITNLQDIEKNNNKNSGQTTTTEEIRITKDINQQLMYSSSQIKIRNEISFRRKNNMPNKIYRFIEDIINENKNKYLIDIRKILKLNDSSIYRLLSYSYDSYSSIISIINY